MRIEDLATPAVLVDFEKLQDNILRMAKKAKAFGVDLRPHIKTHKCIEIAKLQEKAGMVGVTVSTAGELIRFYDAGFEDITFAFPISKTTYDAVSSLLGKNEIKLLVDDSASVKMLNESCEEDGIKTDVLLKIDCGYHRSGVGLYDEKSYELANRIEDAPNLNFEGILTHAGHAYYQQSAEEIKRVAMEEQEAIFVFVDKLRDDYRIECNTTSIGSTPTISLAEQIQRGITEVRPGNYVFYDYTQTVLGSCRLDQCAQTVVATIVGKYSDHIVIDAGATALSKDLGPTHIQPECGYGIIIDDYNDMQPVNDTEIVSLSQEHGVVLISSESPLHQAKIGSKVRIIPNHSCLVTNLFDYFHVVKGSEIKTKWKIERFRVSS